MKTNCSKTNTNHRRFFKIYLVLAGAMLMAGATEVLAAESIDASPVLAKPTADQLAFMDREMGVFCHFSLNTFSGEEHGDGRHSPSLFNPSELNCEQWVRTAKSMGAQYIVLTSRHEDGFCLWPTAATEYNITKSPYKNGKGDIIREFVDACHKYGLKVGLYHTAGFDARHTFKTAEGKTYQGDDDGANSPAKYKAIQLQELTELLSNYGEISYIWCDHWSSADIWRSVTDTMRKLQPHCLMMGPDTTAPGNENGYVVYPMWNAINTTDGTIYSRGTVTKTDHSLSNNYGLLETDVLTGNPFGNIWRSREADTTTGFNRGGWFWHSGKTAAKSLAEHVDLYYRTVGLGANLIINLPPDNRGLIPDDLVAAAKELGDVIAKRFANPIAETGNPPSGDTVELAWEKPELIDTVVSMEKIANGQKIARYTLEAWVNGQWEEVKAANNFPSAKPPFNAHPGFETVGHKKIDRIEPVKTNRLRFRCLKSIAQPVELRRLAVFNCEHAAN